MIAPLDSAPVQRRVLLVDDEPALLRMFEHALKKAGFEVDAVESGVAAKAMLSLRRYDALLTDKNLPDLDGVALAQLARAAQPRLPIVMVTGYSTPELAQSLLNVVDLLFSKPVALKTLVEGVANAIARRAQNAAPRSAAPGDAPVMIVTGDAKQAFRIARMVKDLGRAAEAVASLDELARVHDLSGLVLDAKTVGADGQRAVWRLLGRHEGLKILVLGSDSAKAIGLGAALQLSPDLDDAAMRVGVQQLFSGRAVGSAAPAAAAVG